MCTVPVRLGSTARRYVYVWYVYVPRPRQLLHSARGSSFRIACTVGSLTRSFRTEENIYSFMDPHLGGSRGARAAIDDSRESSSDTRVATCRDLAHTPRDTGARPAPASDPEPAPSSRRESA